MKKLFSSLVIFTFSILALTSCNDSQVTQVNSSNYNKVYNVVDSIRQALQTTLNKTVPSLNLLITTPGEEIFVSSSPVNGTPITADTYFRFASNTKTFTAAAILNMQEDGWLDISHKITDTIPGTTTTYVPPTPTWNIPNKNQITIEQLLQHSAGVYDVSNDSVPGCGGDSYVLFIEKLDPNHQFAVGELVNQATVHRLSYFPPGTNHKYTNTGYSILSEIIGRVYSAKANAPKNYSNYLYDYVVGGNSNVPLDVRFPYLATDNQLPQPNVPGNVYYEDGTVLVTSNGNKSANVGEGNGYGTMRMLKTYIRTLIGGTNVLNTESVNLMKNDISPGSTNYALGCSFVQNLGYGHTGSTRGYFSLMFYDPLTGVSVVGMCPLWDLTNGDTSYYAALYAIINSCYGARSALGYPGRP